ncbi:TPA: hypothetical protein N0F65_011068 [Lagenidium giganteum]|uniref:HAT C-terminal dimerisation domain-containing protein n=1 Tax=Lagenidium giganteum TaxID=4803 RepID=A0AAV2ZLL7_9STRA|nr:TPA: hypothetical protein N0F65_011068 [Lagenidium giganteum]
MMTRFLEIVDTIDKTDARLVDVIPTAREQIHLRSLQNDLNGLDSVNKLLQNNETNLREVRAEFDGVIPDYPVIAKCLSADAEVVKFPDLENAIVKALQGHETDKLSYAEQELRSASQPNTSTYGDLSRIPPTSNVVERLFSKVGRIFSRDRRGIDACTMETLLFLRYNREL